MKSIKITNEMVMIAIAVLASPSVICFDYFVKAEILNHSAVVSSLMCSLALLFFMPVLEDTNVRLALCIQSLALIVMLPLLQPLRLPVALGMLLAFMISQIIPLFGTPALILNKMTLWNDVRLICKGLFLLAFLLVCNLMRALTQTDLPAFLYWIIELSVVIWFLVRAYVSYHGLAFIFARKTQKLIIRTSISMKRQPGGAQQLLSDCQKEVLDRIKDLLETRKYYLKKGLLVSDIAAECYTNKTYVSKLLKADTGMNFNEYVNYLRVGDAPEKLMGESDMNMPDIAESLGFGSLPPFNKSFRFRYGMTPNQYRASHKESVQ